MAGPDVSHNGDTRRIRAEEWATRDGVRIVSAGPTHAILEAETIPESLIRAIIWSEWVIKAIAPFGGSWVRIRVQLENHDGPGGEIVE